jgi:uncharacterized membrane protein YbhN (UPF0104 family)
MRTRIKQIIRFVLRLSVAAVLLAWAFSQVDFGHFRETVAAARWQYLVGVWGFTVLFYWLQSWALQLILRKQDCEVSTHLIFGASCVTSLYGLVLPGFVSTGVKWYILKRNTGKGSNVLSGMLYNQMTLSVVMTVIGLAGLILVNPTKVLLPGVGPSWILPLVCGMALILIVLVSVLLVNERTGAFAIRLLSAILGPLPRAVQEKGQTILTQLTVFQTAGWRFHAVIALINVVDGLLVGLLIYLSAAEAASVAVPLGVLIWLCAIVFILGKIPISIANLGVREVTLVGLLAGYGVAESAALLMSMILFSSLIFLAALGVVYQFAWAVQSRKAASSA